MTRPLVRLLLVLLLLAALLWVWAARSRPEKPSEPGEATHQDGASNSVSRHQSGTIDPETSTGFTVVSSRPEPRPGVPASAELLEEAHAHLDGGGREGTCGAYPRLGDATDPLLLESCDHLAAELDDTYVERLGVTPLGEPAETILLFSERVDYEGFAHQQGMATSGYAAHSKSSLGYAAIWADASRPDDFARTLVHELTHLVNRRALGGNLPRWLSEGLADALGDTATPEGIQPLQGFEGAEGQAKRLRLGYETGGVGGIERLIGLEPGAFDSTPNSYDYEQSTLLVRYLLLDPELGPRFRTFLAELADGAAATPELLEKHLGVKAAELDRRLQNWLGFYSTE